MCDELYEYLDRHHALPNARKFFNDTDSDGDSDGGNGTRKRRPSTYNSISRLTQVF